MFKKIVIGSLAIAVVAGFLLGRDAVSYVHTTASHVTESVKDSVPVEFELDRARKMIAALHPEIRKNLLVIAKEEVEVDRLRRQVEKLSQKLEGDREDLQRMSSDLKSGKSYIVYAGRRYSDNQVRIDLANRLTRVKTSDATLSNLTQVLNARENGLTAARQKLEEMLAARRTLVVEVENLEARQKMVEVAQTASDFNFDDSKLSRTKDLVREIQTRIEVAEKFVNVEGNFCDQIPMEGPSYDSGVDILEEVAAYLGTGEVQPEIETFAELQD